MPEMTLAHLAELTGGQLTGDPARVVRGFASIESAGPDEIAFLANSKYERFMADTKAGAVIVHKNYAGEGQSLIRSGDPYYAFRQAMVAFYGFRKHPFTGVSTKAEIDASAKVAPGASIASFVTVCAGATVGEGTVVYPGAFIGPACRIGRDCIIYPNVTLYDGTVLGDRVTVHAGSSIGHDGFGYSTHGRPPKHEKIPPVGWVELEDDVEIGACCTIDRATMGPTVIGAGTKFSNLVAIGHGTKMGKHCLVVAQVGIAGSVVVGDYCSFAGQVGVEGHIKIGDQVRVGAKSGVAGDVPSGEAILGTPAIPVMQAKRAYLSIAHLPDLRQTVQKLTREVEELRKKLGLEGQ